MVDILVHLTVAFCVPVVMCIGPLADHRHTININ